MGPASGKNLPGLDPPDNNFGELHSIQHLKPRAIDVYRTDMTKQKFIVPDECKIATTNNPMPC